MDILQAIILGIIEGITEFLPISSTGHLILVSHLLNINQTEFVITFEIAIQLGAILAVVFLYKEKLFKNYLLWKKILAAFIPTATLGLFFYPYLKHFFSPLIVSIALITWGIIFIIIELFLKKRKFEIDSLEKISYKKAILIGIFQSFAMIPGTSRSGATIIGGLISGLSRPVATEFSFLLAIPTMCAATGLKLLKSLPLITLDNLILIFVGFLTSFISAFFSIKWLLNFVKNHTFIPFGIYRIILGIICLLFFI